MNGESSSCSSSQWFYAQPPPLPVAETFAAADLCTRAMAIIIDLAFLAGLQALALVAAQRLLISGILQHNLYSFFASTIGVLILVFVLPTLLGLFYFTILHTLGGQTLGKLFLGIRVIDCKAGEAVKMGSSFLRTIGYIISFFPFCAGFLWAMFGRRRRAWHDHLAETLVVLNW